MKSPSFPGRLPLLTVILCLAVAPSLRAGNHAAAETPKSSATTEVVIPKAVFDVTSSPVKDPFFPHTTRSPIPVAAVATTNVAVIGFTPSSFQLKAISGATGNRLAQINNRTMAAGESTEVTTANGKVKIRCVDITDNSVTIQAGNQFEPITLRFRKEF